MNIEGENVVNHAGRSQLVLDKAIDRVRKLLALAKGTSEHEAALAASNAAKLIEQFQLTEAMIRLDEPEAKPEPIEKSARLEPDLAPTKWGGTNDAGEKKGSRKRVAWKETIARATASDLGIHMYWRHHVDVCGFGRESAIQTWRYTYQYLCRAVDELTEARYLIEGDSYSARAWKNAFRVGCAQRIAVRIWEERQRREHATRKHERNVQEVAAVAQMGSPLAHQADRECKALAIIAKDQEQVDAEYKDYAKDWKRSQSRIGSTSSSDGYSAGKAAGDHVRLGGGGKGLPSGRGRLRGGRS